MKKAINIVPILYVNLLININNIYATSLQNFYDDVETNININNNVDNETILLNIGNVNIKYHYEDNKIHYDYENIVCSNCNNQIPNIIDSLLDQKLLLSDIMQCSACDKFFNTVNINQQ